jgi:hypothetical protein
MAAKFDKEFLAKHHFWLLFAPIGLCLLIACYALAIDVPDEIEAKKLEHENKQKTLAASGKVLPRKVLDVYDKQIEDLNKQRGVLWKEGWNDQKELFNWPAGYTDRQRDERPALRR